MEYHIALGGTTSLDALNLLHVVEGRLNWHTLRVQTGGTDCPPSMVCVDGKSPIGPPHAPHHTVEAFVLSALFILTLIVGLGIGFGAGYLNGKRAARVDR